MANTYPRSTIPEPYQREIRERLRKIPTWELQKAYGKLKAGEATGIELVEQNRAYAISAIEEALWERGKLPTGGSHSSGVALITEAEWNRMFLTLAPLVTGALSVGLGLLALTRSSPLGRRVYCSDGQYLVSVRYGQWDDIRDFVQPADPDVVAIYHQIGPDAWGCLDFVCRNISYRSDIGEFWQFPLETLRGAGDCEDSAILTCSLLKNFNDGYVVLGDYQGYGHAWCQLNGEILETTYTQGRPVPDPEHYIPYVLFDDRDVIELWPGALEDIFNLRRDEGTKLNLMARAIGNEVPPECPSCWPFLVIGGIMGGILGTSFAVALQKGEEAR